MTLTTLLITFELIVVILWIICGFFAYGVIKNFWQELYSKSDKKDCYRFDNECICILMALIGPFGLVFGLLVAFVAKWTMKYKVDLCYRMPDSLKKVSL